MQIEYVSDIMGRGTICFSENFECSEKFVFKISKAVKVLQ